MSDGRTGSISCRFVKNRWRTQRRDIPNGTTTKPATPRYVQPYRYASPNIPLSATQRFARQIAEKFAPDKIILFGSYAYGTPHDQSDLSLPP